MEKYCRLPGFIRSVLLLGAPAAFPLGASVWPILGLHTLLSGISKAHIAVMDPRVRQRHHSIRECPKALLFGSGGGRGCKYHPTYRGSYSIQGCERSGYVKSYSPNGKYDNLNRIPPLLYIVRSIHLQREKVIEAKLLKPVILQWVTARLALRA